MDMNMTDPAALRHVIAHERHGSQLTCKAWRRAAQDLRVPPARSCWTVSPLRGICSGSRTRTIAARAVVVATDHGRHGGPRRLDGLHGQDAAEAAERKLEEARGEVAAFLRRIAGVLDAESTSDAPLSSVERSISGLSLSRADDDPAGDREASGTLSGVPSRASSRTRDSGAAAASRAPALPGMASRRACTVPRHCSTRPARRCSVRS